MKSNKGFTLIELLVGILIMGIIFGGIIYIFAGSTLAARTGMNQKQVYEDARVTMDYLKTTIRYAVVTDGKVFETIPADTSDNTVTVLKYTSVLKKHPRTGDSADPDNSSLIDNKTWKITVALENGKNSDGSAWTDGNKKQLVIYSKDVTSDTAADYPTPGTTATGIKITRFPKYEANSGLIAAGAYTEGSNTYESGFPIVSESSPTSYTASSSIYRILLPLVFKAGNENKTDTLVSSVSVSDMDYNLNSGSGGGTITTPDKLANKAQDIASFIADAAKNNPGVLKINNGRYAGQIASGAFFKTQNTAGVTEKVYGYTDASGKKLTDYVGDTAWQLVALTSPEVMNIHLPNTDRPYGYRLFIAKNVINDLKTKNGAYARTSDTELLADAKQGIYVIRPFYSFITYYFDFTIDGTLTNYGVRGYASCTDNVAKDADDGIEKHYFSVNYASWKVASADKSEGYLQVNDSSGKSESNHNIYLADDTSKANNNTWKNASYIEDTAYYGTGTHRRIDYDGRGAEYTTATAGDSYSYPPNGATQN
jgi:prepilin-type N-terminal cleavage/methylation domain-containing protein